MTDLSASPAYVPLAVCEQLARQIASASAWKYVDSGAADEITMSEASPSWNSWRLLPRVCRDVRDIDTSTTFMGSDHAHPIVVGPTGCHKMMNDAGEPATAAGAAAAGAPFVLSSYTTSTIPEVSAAATGQWWMQVNVPPDTGFVHELLAEAKEYGASGVVFTVDTPVAGLRERQGWDGVTLPEGMEFGVLAKAPFQTRPPAHFDDIYRPALDAGLVWNKLAALIQAAGIPVAVKGILHPEDARLAVDSGASAVIVSNHGGRNLDTTVPTALALPAVAAALGSAVPLLVDGGIRRGTDVVKALALGASGVLVGRPALWGLAVDGQRGVEAVVRRLHYELRMSMASCGARSIQEVRELDLIR